MKPRVLIPWLAVALVVAGALYITSLGIVTTGAADVAKSSRGAEHRADSLEGRAPTPEPMAPSCNQCTNSFCPVNGVRCNLSNCENGAHGCCNYSCSCDATCTTVSLPENVCTYSTPCCAGLGITSFCKFVDVKCYATGCAGSCWSYECVDEPCYPVDNCPPNACPGTCN
ncbi:MAG TPA: hypothetical protein VGR38_07960 [Candidatus Polarisedimenticolia bacterium]|nr:hypothetical protein [Candidatus Polarisedimenticolia bacterium]